jgi:hypothetical protein
MIDEILLGERRDYEEGLSLGIGAPSLDPDERRAMSADARPVQLIGVVRVRSRDR